MTRKQRMLAVLQGQPVDRIPWVPRLDLWYRAHRRADTLPKAYAGCSLVEMTDQLGFGSHAVVPDFKEDAAELLVAAEYTTSAQPAAAAETQVEEEAWRAARPQETRATFDSHRRV